MNDAIKVSFVIPAYNERDYVGRCIKAVMREIRGRNDAEIIVVDNNSIDGTDKVIEGYPGVKLLRETRRGANAARKRGFDEAKGELVAFPDADTMIPEGWLAGAEAEFAKDPDLVCISGPFVYYDLPKRIQLMVKMFYVLDYLVYLLGRAILRKSTTIQGGNYVVRRDALVAAQGLNPNISFYGDDTDLALRMSKVGKVKFSLKMKTLSSGRRLAKEGAWTMGFRYTLNNFWMVVARRPWTKSSTEVRFEGGRTVYAPSKLGREIAIAALFVAAWLAAIGIVGSIAYWLVVYR